MPNNLFIAGLPRSRTAWLSVFMSQSDIYFYHEAINDCHSIKEYRDKIKGFGDSSTGLVYLGVDIIQDSKVVIINKTDDQLKNCIDWCDHTYGMNSRDFILDENDKLKKLKGLHVNQSDIDSRLKEIWCYLVDTPWDDKYSMLTKLNIQVQSTSINEEAARSLNESIQKNTQ